MSRLAGDRCGAVNRRASPGHDRGSGPVRSGHLGPVVSSPALGHASAAHKVAKVGSPQGAVSHHPVIGSATGAASDDLAKGDLSEDRFRFGTSRLAQFGRVIVRKPDLNPSAAHVNAEAVTVPDIDHRAAKDCP